MPDTGKSNLPHYNWPYGRELPSGAGTVIISLPSHATLADLKWLAGEVSRDPHSDKPLPSGVGTAMIRWPSNVTPADLEWLVKEIYTDPDYRLPLIKK